MWGILEVKEYCFTQNRRHLGYNTELDSFGDIWAWSTGNHVHDYKICLADQDSGSRKMD